MSGPATRSVPGQATWRVLQVQQGEDGVVDLRIGADEEQQVTLRCGSHHLANALGRLIHGQHLHQMHPALRALLPVHVLAQPLEACGSHGAELWLAAPEPALPQADEDAAALPAVDDEAIHGHEADALLGRQQAAEDLQRWLPLVISDGFVPLPGFAGSVALVYPKARLSVLPLPGGRAVRVWLDAGAAVAAHG